MSNNTGRLKEVQSDIARYSLLSKVCVVLIALGLYGLFGTNGHPFLPIFGNSRFVYSMIALGIIGELKVISKLLPLWQEKGSLLGKD